MLTASGSAGSTSYAYNGDGLATSVADAAGTTGYTYDNAGRLATLADPATGTTATYSYNSDSQVTGISYGSGKDTRSFGYDGQRRLTSDTLKTSAGATVASVGLRVQRRRRDHLRGHHRPGRAGLEHVHLRPGGPADLVEQRHRHDRVRLRRQREPDPGRAEDLHLRRP